ncbi:uncharacterized protein AB9W97_006791 [Spinachia spinachia]
MDFPGHFQYIFQQLNQQRLCGQLCDCVVLVGPQSFRAHRSILAACSSHFRALLSSSNTRVEVGGPGGDYDGLRVIELDPEVVTPEAFSTLLDMIYTSTLSPGSSNVMDVLLAESHLHLNNVVKIYKLHLSSKNVPALPPEGWRPGGERPGRCGARCCTIFVQEDGHGHRKRSCRSPERDFEECLLTVTRSTSTEEGGVELPTMDPLKTTNRLAESRGEKKKKEERRQKKTGEIQLPRQSNLTVGGVGVWKDGDTEGDPVVKIKVEKGEQPKLMEGGKENSPGLANNSPPSLQEDYNNNLDSLLKEEKKNVQLCSLPSQVGGDLQTAAQRDAGPLGEGCVKREGLDGPLEHALSCFLNPSRESVTGAPEEGDRLASLTPAMARDAPAGGAGERCQTSEVVSIAQFSDSSLVFPVFADALQHILPNQGPDLSDTPMLQPTESPLSGFPVYSKPRRKNSLIQSPVDGKSIAPKVPAHGVSEGDSSNGPYWTGADEDCVLHLKGEKKYACKICSKTFVKFRPCKEHIYGHMCKTLSKV